MDDICNRVYESTLFYKNKTDLYKEGKTKMDILKIIEMKITNIASENNDLQTFIKSQIIEIFKDEFEGDISDIICSIIKEYYQKQPPKLKENLSLFKDYCNEHSDVCMEELIISLLMNVETRAINIVREEITDFINNHFSNKLWTDYFHKNNCQQEIFDESLKESKRDIISLSKSYSRLDNLIKNQAKSNIEFTTRIVNDILNSRRNEIEFLLKNFEKKLEQYDITNDAKNIDKMINISLKKSTTRLDKAFEKINQLEKKIKNIEYCHNEERKLLSNKIQVTNSVNEKLKINIEHLSSKINSDEKDLNIKINKINLNIQEIKNKYNNLKKDDLTKMNESFKTNNEKYNDLVINLNKINDTIKSLSKQCVQKDILIYEEIDKKIDDKFKYVNNNENIKIIQREIIELRAQIDLIYRHRSQEIQQTLTPNQVNQFYPSYSMY